MGVNTEGACKGFWGSGHILFLDLAAGYIAYIHYVEIHRVITLMICILYV